MPWALEIFPQLTFRTSWSCNFRAVPVVSVYYRPIWPVAYLHLDVQGKGLILLAITEFVSKPISTVFQLH